MGNPNASDRQLIDGAEISILIVGIKGCISCWWQWVDRRAGAWFCDGEEGQRIRRLRTMRWGRGRLKVWLEKELRVNGVISNSVIQTFGGT